MAYDNLRRVQNDFGSKFLILGTCMGQVWMPGAIEERRQDPAKMVEIYCPPRCACGGAYRSYEDPNSEVPVDHRRRDSDTTIDEFLASEDSEFQLQESLQEAPPSLKTEVSFEENFQRGYRRTELDDLLDQHSDSTSFSSFPRLSQNVSPKKKIPAFDHDKSRSTSTSTIRDPPPKPKARFGEFSPNTTSTPRGSLNGRPDLSFHLEPRKISLQCFQSKLLFLLGTPEPDGWCDVPTADVLMGQQVHKRSEANEWPNVPPTPVQDAPPASPSVASFPSFTGEEMQALIDDRDPQDVPSHVVLASATSLLTNNVKTEVVPPFPDIPVWSALFFNHPVCLVGVIILITPIDTNMPIPYHTNWMGNVFPSIDLNDLESVVSGASSTLSDNDKTTALVVFVDEASDASLWTRDDS
ncbi:hypothetical protein L596_013563 [Steinernema carpocapsae]|uniref:Uncharacterized protein n=1 Tax=Steinernema carpocapsae TaxID=34508 RepID=A0A4V6XWG5_STECR|nr:hypothetical protein L596_013563 [Steinernema carpocapsae]